MEGNAFSDLLILNFSKNTIDIALGGRNITADIKYKYVYSNDLPYPFLSILFTDDKEVEHLLYFVIGTDSKEKMKY